MNNYTTDTGSVTGGQLESTAGYDASKTSNRRRRPPRAMKSADRYQTALQRKQLISGSRDQSRNFSIAAWAIRKHLDYVANLNWRPRTADKAFNQTLTDWFDEWSMPWNCDASRRHSFAQLVRHWEERRTADGDVAILKLGSGAVQTIEGDRIRTPHDNERGSIYHGVEVTPTGAAARYHIHKRTDDGRFEYDRAVQSNRCWLFGYYDRIDQVRGVSPLAPALNTFQDVYEAFGYALSKAKISQLFGLVFYRDAIEPLEGPTTDDDDADGTYDVSFDNGNVPVLDLLPGDRAEFLENKTPAAEFQSYCQQMVGVALKALDIPYSFFDESHSNYSGARQALLQYEQSAQHKRRDLIGLCDQILGWRLAMAVERSEIVVPSGLRLRWEWVPSGLPWIDPLKEVNADIAAINAGLTSRTQIVKRRTGQDWLDVIDELDAERAELVSRGLVTELGATDDETE